MKSHISKGLSGPDKISALLDGSFSFDNDEHGSVIIRIKVGSPTSTGDDCDVVELVIATDVAERVGLTLPKVAGEPTTDAIPCRVGIHRHRG